MSQANYTISHIGNKNMIRNADIRLFKILKGPDESKIKKINQCINNNPTEL